MAVTISLHTGRGPYTGPSLLIGAPGNVAETLGAFDT